MQIAFLSQKVIRYYVGNLCEETLMRYNKGNKFRYGLISLDTLLHLSAEVDLHKYCAKHNIAIPQESAESSNLLCDTILRHYLVKFNLDSSAKKKYHDPLMYLGTELWADLPVTRDPTLFDFIAKSDLLDRFADYCADINIHVYQTGEDNPYDMDLYLTKKQKGVFVITESVFALTGQEIEAKYNNDYIEKIQRSETIADWKVFVTTPAGAMKIGFQQLMEDMKRAGAWVYILDPVQKRVFGVMKGRKSKSKDEQILQRFIRQLPQTPLRAPSQVVKISEYAFEEKHAYKPKDIHTYIIRESAEIFAREAKYHKIFKSLLILGKQSGLMLHSFSESSSDENNQMISGFISALDSFVHELSGSSGMKEISYKGFSIYAGVGELVKIIAITTRSVDKAFIERLGFLTTEFESRYSKEINIFLTTGSATLKENKEINTFIAKILDV